MLDDRKFIYDDWNLIAELHWNPSTSSFDLNSIYTWGLDLSNSLQGAGGVGGLLAVTIGADSFYATYDVNGNVSEYLDDTGAVEAHFEYDTFGRMVASGGIDLERFVYRFSTKYEDGDAGLYCYGFRYYNPSTGRWPSRDPIGENGGLNLYAMVSNNAVNYIDRLGLQRTDPIKCQKAYIIGHSHLVSDLLNEFNNRSDSCSSASGNGCNYDGSNGDKGIPGFIPTPNDYFGVTYNPNNPYCGNAGCNPTNEDTPQNEARGFVSLVTQNWTKTKEAAEKAAEDCKCECQKIIAKFVCQDPFTDAQLSRIVRTAGSGSLPKCGEVVEYQCKKNSK